ncbi:MAG: aminotransferase class V-fold PLP-dependent enzyme [Bacteroidota bacterium]
MKSIVYLDYNSTTPVDARVLEVMLPYFSEKFGNAASRTHRFGWVAEEAVKTAREKVAQLIHAAEQEIIFTSGATEAINLAIKGVFESYKSKGDHIVTVKTEHKAVLDTCKALEKKGARVTYLDADREGLIDIDELEKAVTDKTILVSVMLANNETGVIQPLREIADRVHARGGILLSDATQAVGKIRCDVQELGIDLLCLSAHKLYGPKGTGALFVRRKDPRVSLQALIHGGGHERGLRSGTLNVPGIAGLGKACELAQAEMWDEGERLSRLRTYLEQHLLDLGKVYVNGSTRYRLPHVSNLAFSGLKADELIAKMPDIAVATGSACTSAIPEPSHVLRAMGVSDELAYGSIRFSLGKGCTAEEIGYTVKRLSEVIPVLRK